jgi:hypothetical protein
VEHRCGERLPVSLTATIRKPNGEAIGVTIRNLSMGGAFIALPRGRTILRGLVGLELHLPGAARQLSRWRAYVVHQHADGVGLMFDECKSAERPPFLAAQRAMRSATRAVRSALERVQL